MRRTSILGATPRFHLIPLHWSTAKFWSLLSLRSQPNGLTAFLFGKASNSRPEAKSNFRSNSTLLSTATAGPWVSQTLQTLFRPGAAKPKGIGQGRQWHVSTFKIVLFLMWESAPSLISTRWAGTCYSEITQTLRQSPPHTSTDLYSCGFFSKDS